MLALLLAVAMQSAPITAPHAIEAGALTMEAPDWSFVPLPSWQGPTRAVESLMFAVDIDPTEPDQSEERADLDVYETEEMP